MQRGSLREVGTRIGTGAADSEQLAISNLSRSQVKKVEKRESVSVTFQFKERKSRLGHTIPWNGNEVEGARQARLFSLDIRQ